MVTVHMQRKHWARILPDQTSEQICRPPAIRDKTVVSSDQVLLAVDVNLREEKRVVHPLPDVLLHSSDARDHGQLE